MSTTLTSSPASRLTSSGSLFRGAAHCRLGLSALPHSILTRPGSSPLVVFAKGKKSPIPSQGRRAPGQQVPGAIPGLDPSDDNPKFVIFIRTLQSNRWFPVTIVTGGSTARMMTMLTQSEFGRKLYQPTLTRNIGTVIYKDEPSIREVALKQFPILKSAGGYAYGYKLVDLASGSPRSAMSGTNVIRIPQKKDLKSVVERAVESWGQVFSEMRQNLPGAAK